MKWSALIQALCVGGVLFLCTGLLEAQEAPADDNETEGTTPATEEPLRDLELETLSQDVENLNFFQLVAWLERLNLSTQGNRRGLQTRLYEYYGVDPSANQSESEAQSNRQAIIESALAGDYFEQVDSSEDYLHLRGGVSVRFVDKEEDVEHLIEAQELIFNQTENIMTARGDVRYTIKRGGGTEQFFGNTISFQVESWHGYFIDGGGTTDQASEDSTLFRYTADFISRSPEDVVVMEDVAITSSPAADPFYRIEASKVWIIGEGEWGLRDATIYVGEVPLFYFPNFFRPGDEVLFHPVFGARDREGLFIQTTTYFLGKKAAPQDRFSFLQSTDNSANQQVLEGIFLRNSSIPVEGDAPDPSWYLKLLVDYYSRLGVYTGLDGSFSNLTPIQTLQFQTAIAASRYIYPSAGSVAGFTTFHKDGDRVSEQWVQSTFLGTELPFRYFVDINMALSLGGLNGNLLFELYSDRYISQDFGDRAEENDWFSIVSGATPFVSTTTASTTTSFQWRADSSFSIPSPLNPFISSIQVSDLTFSLNWLNKSDTSGNLPSYVTDAHNSPGRDFFYPSTAIAPNARIQMSGTLFNPAIARGEGLPTPQVSIESESPVEADVSGVELLVPWEQSAEEDEEETEDEALKPEVPPVAPHTQEVQRLADYGGYTPYVPLNYGVTYNLSTTNNVQANTNNQTWLQASDVDFEILYSTYSSDNQISLNYFTDFYQSYLKFDGSTTFNGRYQTLFPDSLLSDSERIRLSTQAYRYNLFNINNSTTLSSLFLQEIETLRTSSLRYSISAKIYEYNLDTVDTEGNPTYKDTFVGWNTQTITNHVTSLNLVWSVLNNNQTLTLEYRMPPFDQRFSSALALRFWWIGLGAQLSATEQPNSDIWKFDPLIANASITPFSELSLASQLTVNLEESYVETLTFNLRSWFLNTQFVMRYVEDIQFDPDFLSAGTSSPWLSQGPEELRPTQLQATINETVTTDPFWKNRIRLSFTYNNTLNLDLQRFTQSSFSLGLGLSLFVHEFLEISFSTSVLNNQIYLYVSELADMTGRTPRNLFLDLLKSINIFNPDDLAEGLFKVQNISLQVIHHLVDWDLRFELSASPTLITESGALPRYEWDQKFSILITWQPIPELRKDIRVDREGTITVDPE